MRIATYTKLLSKVLMRSLAMGIIWLLFVSVLCAQTDERVRPMVAAGSYYPADSASLSHMLEGLFARAETLQTHDEVLGVLAPHAGYPYSGIVAASAVNQLDAFRKYETVFLLGTSHHEAYRGASVYRGRAYQTPLGNVPINRQLVDTLIAGSSLFRFHKQAHDKEHSLEVVLPFLQYKLKKPFSIVPILVGARDLRELEQMAEILQPYLKSRNLFIISTDFSHYPAYEEAVKVDSHVGEALATGKVHRLINALNETGSMGIKELHTSMCGWPSTVAFLYMLQQLPEAEVVPVEYRNSGDAVGDKSRVVGYHAMAFVKKRENSMNNQGSFRLTDEEKSELLALARRTLKTYLSTGSYDKAESEELSPALKQEGGAFVTLHSSGALRGCIGQFPRSKPLYEVVQEMAIAAAVKDSRFPPVEPQELDAIEIEISVLTPMEKIADPSEIELGRHGIYIRKGLASGTFLPQVATETGWTKEEFLGHCAKDKAGIGWEGWKEADLFRYEAFVFSE
ncbi:MAG: AmmeMemoRadiSam system protein B [Bacteroidales bacterium]